jgi:hypothetical protein
MHLDLSEEKKKIKDITEIWLCFRHALFNLHRTTRFSTFYCQVQKLLFADPRPKSHGELAAAPAALTLTIMPPRRPIPLLQVGQVPPESRECANVRKGINRCMLQCGIVWTVARRAFALLYCTVCMLKDQNLRTRVAFAMGILIRDHNFLLPHEAHTVRLAFEINKMRTELLSRAADVQPLVIHAAPALPGANAVDNWESD